MDDLDDLLARRDRPQHLMPHGAFAHLTRLAAERPLPVELGRVEVPVVLFFGLLRPYKGLEVLVQAWRGVEDAELWIVGMPRMDISALRARAHESVRFLPRFVTDAELRACFGRADLVVLPYLEIDQSGVLFTAHPLTGRRDHALINACWGLGEGAPCRPAARAWSSAR